MVMPLVGLLVIAACGGGTADPAPGSDDTQTTTTAGSSGTQGGRQAPSSQDVPFESGDGHFEVDGTRFDAAWVVSCIVEEDFFGNPPDPEDLDVRASAEEGSSSGFFEVGVTVTEVEPMSHDGPGYRALTVSTFYHRSRGEGPEQFEMSVTTGPDGSWYRSGEIIPQMAVEGQEGLGITGEPLSGLNITVESSRLEGGLTLDQDWPQGADGMVDITWEFDLPGEKFNCDEL